MNIGVDGTHTSSRGYTPLTDCLYMQRDCAAPSGGTWYSMGALGHYPLCSDT